MSKPPAALLLAAAILLLPGGRVLPSDQDQSAEDGRRLSVLFLGAPTGNNPSHDPIERYRVIRQHLGIHGIDFTYTEDPADLRRDVLDLFDALLMYANWDQNGPMNPDWESALIGYVEDGGGFLPIHSASACFGASDAFVALVGARFLSHGEGVFRARIVNPDHPIMRDYESFEAWDETYVHDRHADDRTILQLRDDEPWTWVRHQGKGRVFYTAYGHDMRCWEHPGFHDLLHRAILWTAGDEAATRLAALSLPEVEMEEMLLPGYQTKEKITSGQKPLAPSESIKLAQVPTGFELSLFAHEPDIVNPIHVAWDHLGRAFVIETVDYPNNLQDGNIGNDRILLCEDRNGDGSADTFTVFADGLSVPTSMVFANGGVICTNGTEILFLQDTTGDNRADVRRVLFDGFKMHDTHAGPSNLRYGFDNWIHATIGYSGFEGQVGDTKHSFSTGHFRFRPDGSELEFLQNTTNNTWGLGFTSDFDILGSTANANPSWFATFPKAVYLAADLEAPRTPRADDNPLFFPISTDIRQVDVFGRYTAAAGHSFITSSRFPESWREHLAMVAEPTGKLVGLFATKRHGAGWISRQLPNNLYNSADAWSAPVQAETGPDGAVWICDWYNLIIQHNPTPTVAAAGVDFQTGRGNAYETPLRDTRHGRIYRVFPAGSPNDQNPGLNPAQPEGLVAALDHPNQFWRLQAQRLLVESRAHSTKPALRQLIAGPHAHAALHAFYALDGMQGIDESTLSAALSSTHRGLRRAAINHPASCALLLTHFTQINVFAAADTRELAELFVALARQQPSQAVGASLLFTALAQKDALATDQVLADAWQIAARRHAVGVLLAASELHLDDSNTNALDPDDPESMLAGVAQFVAEHATPEDKNELTGALARTTSSTPRKWVEALRAAPPATPITARQHQPDPAIHQRGAAVYTRFCIACHGPDGRGVPGAFPPLDGSLRIVGDPSVPIRITLHGMTGPIDTPSGQFNNPMAPLGHLSDTEIADVLTYVRQHWNNDAPPIQADTVAEIRAAHQDRAAPWTQEELAGNQEP